MPIALLIAAWQILKFAMVNADHTIKEQTERSESMRYLIVKSVLCPTFGANLSSWLSHRLKNFDNRRIHSIEGHTDCKSARALWESGGCRK